MLPGWPDDLILAAYKAYFFGMANVEDPFAMSNVLSTAGLLAIIINSLIVVRYGRRRVLLMSGLMICGVLQLIIAVVYQEQPGTTSTGKTIVALSCIYMFSYNGESLLGLTSPLMCSSKLTTLGMIATYAWLSGGEIPSQRLRSHTFGFAAAVGFAGAWLTQFTAPYFINPESLNWGPRYGFIWFPSCVIAAIWVFFFLPEVKNRTLEEVTEMVRRPAPLKTGKQQEQDANSLSSSKLVSQPGSSGHTSVSVTSPSPRTNSVARVSRKLSPKTRRPPQRSKSLPGEVGQYVPGGSSVNRRQTARSFLQISKHSYKRASPSHPALSAVGQSSVEFHLPGRQ